MNFIWERKGLERGPKSDFLRSTWRNLKTLPVEWRYNNILSPSPIFGKMGFLGNVFLK